MKKIKFPNFISHSLSVSMINKINFHSDLFSAICCNSGTEDSGKSNKLNELIISLKTNLVRVARPLFPGLKHIWLISQKSFSFPPRLISIYKHSTPIIGPQQAPTHLLGSYGNYPTTHISFFPHLNSEKCIHGPHIFQLYSTVI